MKSLLVRWIAWVFRRLPIKSGLTPLSFNHVMNRLMGVGTALPAPMRGGSEIMVRSDDYHGRILYLFGTNDPKVEACAVALSRPGDVFLDIGANHGSIGFAVSDKVGRTGAVHLFEPQRELAERVARAVSLAASDNIRLHVIGLMDRDGVLPMRAPQRHSGMATFAIDDARTTAFEREETCVVKAIDRFVGPLVDGRPFGVKIDIEGSELIVLPWIVGQPTLRFVIFEAANNERALFRLFQLAGMRMFGLRRNPLFVELRLLSDEADIERFHDVVAIRTARDQLPRRLSPRQLAELIT